MDTDAEPAITQTGTDKNAEDVALGWETWILRTRAIKRAAASTTHTCTAVVCRRRLVTLSAAVKLNDRAKCAYLN